MREVPLTADRTVRDASSDRFIARIEETVRLKTGGMIQGLRVEVGQDHVILTGRTSTFYGKQLATHAALNALDDRSLSNLIVVN